MSLLLTKAGRSSPSIIFLSNPPTVTQHPSDQVAVEGGTATFTAVFSGAASYQWYLDDVAISGATNASYTTDALTLNDSGGTYHCVGTNAYGSTQTNDALLIVYSPLRYRSPTMARSLV